MYVVKYIKYGSEEYDRTLKLRNEVMYKPISKSMYDIDVSCEADQIIIGAFETNTMVRDLLIGIGILSYKGDNKWFVEYVCVDTVLQKKGVGSALMQCLEKIVRERGATVLGLDSRLATIDFYQRFGFVQKGEIFYKDIAPVGHVYMEKELPAIPKEIREHSHGCSCGCGGDHHHHHEH